MPSTCVTTWLQTRYLEESGGIEPLPFPAPQGSNLLVHRWTALSLEEDVRLELTHPFLGYCLFSKEIPYLIRVNLPDVAEKERIELSSRFTSQHLSKVFSSPVDLLLQFGVTCGYRAHFLNVTG